MNSAECWHRQRTVVTPATNGGESVTAAFVFNQTVSLQEAGSAQFWSALMPPDFIVVETTGLADPLPVPLTFMV